MNFRSGAVRIGQAETENRKQEKRQPFRLKQGSRKQGRLKQVSRSD